MKLFVNPGQPLRGVVKPPGDKSISHRAALFAALAEGQSRIRNFLMAGVTDVMLHALREVGISCVFNQGILTIQGKGLSGWEMPSRDIDCGNSGSTLRLLAGALTTTNVAAVLDGSYGLRRRPMKRIVAPLQEMGALIKSTDQGTAPLVLEKRLPRSLRGITHELAVASAQVKTAILLAGLAADAPTTIREPAQSRDHTERMLSVMGIGVDQKWIDGENVVVLTPPNHNGLSPLDFTIPGDFSSASFMIVAALITPGSDILISDVGLNPSRIGLLDVLREMGANIHVTQKPDQGNEPVGDIQVKHSKLEGVHVSGDKVVRMIDEFPVFGIAGAYASGNTKVSQAAELRLKESDRISSVCTQLKAVGVQVEEHEDGFTITGNTLPRGGEVQPNRDHRLAMSFAVCGLGAQNGITIVDAEIFSESYPGFVDALQRLGADITCE